MIDCETDLPLEHIADDEARMPVLGRPVVKAGQRQRMQIGLMRSHRVRLDADLGQVVQDPLFVPRLFVHVLVEKVADLPRLQLAGLMCIPPFLEKAEQVRPYFRRLKDLRDELAATLGLALPVVSMGMSHDFEVAIEEGATEVRVGTALFGARDIT